MMKSFLAAVGGLALLAAVIASIAAVGGWYDVGADRPHIAPVEALLESVRMRALATHATTPHAALPTDENALRLGGEHYAEMCAGCHLAPGADDRDLHDGLYPRPPDFTKSRVDPGVAFWTIKHGIKMTGMPAWGPSHDDDTIWDIVAFVEKLPGMQPSAYRLLTGAAAPSNDPGAQGEHASAEHAGHHHHPP